MRLKLVDPNRDRTLTRPLTDVPLHSHVQRPAVLQPAVPGTSFVTSRLELTVCNAQNIRRYYYSPFYVRISDRRRLLVEPRVAVSARHGCRAFSVAGPTLWNSLPDNLRDPTETRQLQISLENVFCYYFHASLMALDVPRQRALQMHVFLTYLFF